MRTNLPQPAENLVGWFLPPACREEVLGDLFESCENPAQYVLSALAVAPRVIFSQIRRNTDSLVFLFTACALAYSFITGSADMSRGLAHAGLSHALLRLAIPSIAALASLLLCNGFAPAEERRLHAITFDIVVTMAAAAITQLVLLVLLQRGLMLPGWCPSEGAALSWVAIILLRAIFPPGVKLPPAQRSLS
jgi:hypothetical protein